MAYITASQNDLCPRSNTNPRPTQYLFHKENVSKIARRIKLKKLATHPGHTLSKANSHIKKIVKDLGEGGGFILGQQFAVGQHFAQLTMLINLI
ncbi:hypothetical protein E4U13_006962 [Claviceps humidiphila]|uniref:Uncharacterized protein n=2 Tax=Claviceps TaxID=5110 RepID=A0A9P7PTP3_9HYPO|nr:hypothetical protein E4U57_005544 [Claviceps arundinis]KAG6107499.1 hypothetical protein E4U13_006962 [Claviceps humidiphila]